MRKIKDKDTEILESELTVIGFVFILILMLGQMFVQDMRVKSLDKDLWEAKTIAVELYEDKQVYIDMVNSLNDALDETEKDLENYKYLERLLKELR